MGDSRRWAAEQEEERERLRHQQANHPTIHCNRMEPAGNVNVHDPAYQSRPAILPKATPTNFGAHMTIPEEVLQRTAVEFPEKIQASALEPSHEIHGVGSHELPDVVSPEEWIDRYTHISACKAILLLEAGFLRSEPQATGAGGKFIETRIKMDLDGRVWDIVKQKYLDVGWKNAQRFPFDGGKETVVQLLFP